MWIGAQQQGEPLHCSQQDNSPALTAHSAQFTSQPFGLGRNRFSR